MTYKTKGRFLKRPFLPLIDVGKQIHKLSSIDPITQTAICANCGRVGIRNKSGTWKCRIALKKWNGNGKRRGLSALTAPFKKTYCERCNFGSDDSADEVQLDVHHRDGDISNNDPANLETICANCHRLEHKAGLSAPFGT